MEKLGIDPLSIEEVFISHSHADHTAGLDSFLRVNPVKVYVPLSCSEPAGASEVVKVAEPLVLHPNIMSTGELGEIEQSLVLRMEKGTAVVVGCAHPGVGLILDTAAQFGEPYAIVGGLHDSREFEALGRLELICGAHCTRYKAEIRALYPDKWVEAGAGRVIEV
jgi:7,8-dihydropterin-6-yl-methyl-4-(beta-D-ribofuranosyl)aminobenzene 5'-phosphate synthase